MYRGMYWPSLTVGVLEHRCYHEVAEARGATTHDSAEALAMAAVMACREGVQPPGKMYSRMKSEVRRYSS